MSWEMEVSEKSKQISPSGLEEQYRKVRLQIVYLVVISHRNKA